MYVEPNNIIKILRQVPLDNTYDHTIYFENEAAQLAFFQGRIPQPTQENPDASIARVKYTLERQSFQRTKRGWLRVKLPVGDLYDCNYIMFKNTGTNIGGGGINYGSKWFYAFLKSANFINNDVTEIEFEIDDVQTWMFDYELEECFVEREHSSSDELFENIIDEGLDIGDEYVYHANDTYDMNTMGVAILVNRKNATTDPQNPQQSRCINRIYVPVETYSGISPTSTGGIAALDAWLDQFNENDIICLYQYPLQFGDDSTGNPLTFTKSVIPNVPRAGVSSPATIDGYVPKNKKLFCYPYNFLLVSNNSGDTATYRWENWDLTTRPYADFNITGVVYTTPACICYPTRYRKIPTVYEPQPEDPENPDVLIPPYAYDDGLMLSNFPQCAWSGDTFKAWWAQNKASFVTSAISQTISGVTAGISAGMSAGLGALAMGIPVPAAAAAGVGTAAATAIPSISETIATKVAKIKDIQHTPSQTHGQTQTDSLNAGMKRVQFNFYSMCIKEQYARIVDDYFSKFGYATKRLKVPNRNARPHWTYTKTIGCVIAGSIPSDSARHICQIFDNGITFWRNGNEVGNYSLDNSPVTQNPVTQNS